MFTSRRLSASMSPAAMIVAILALVLAGAGVGWSAATIGTSDIKNNAVTSKKVKNGTLKAADMVKEKMFTAPTLGIGTEGDCIWHDLADDLPGLARAGFRVDRFGTTHLSGVMMVDDGPGGDTACGGGSTAEAIDDLTAFRLPKAARPASLIYEVQTFGSDTFLLIIPGPGGLEVSPGVVLPHGALVALLGAGSTFFLDQVSFETMRAKVTPPISPKQISPRGRELLKGFLKNS